MFRIQSIEHISNRISSNAINLTKDIVSGMEASNYYTILIGNNGCGKSRTLRGVSSYFNPYRKIKDSLKVSLIGELSPSKTIVITNGIGDTYEYDLSDKRSFNELKYVYLGTRLKYGAYSKKMHLERAVRAYVECNPKIINRDLFRDIFTFCGYRDHVVLQYNLIKGFQNQKNSRAYTDAVEKLKRNNVDSSELQTVLEILNGIDNANINKKYGRRKSHEYFVELHLDFSFGVYDIRFNKYNLSPEQILLLRRFGVLELSNALISNNLGFDNISSGESNLLTSMLALLSTISDNSLVLIDEPEISLHPAWQSKYISLLEKIVEIKSGCHIIIATHSHFIPSDLKPDNSCVVCLSKEDDGSRIVATQIPDSPYAWSAENILLEVFGVPSTRNYYFANKLQGILTQLAKVEKDWNVIRENIRIIKSVVPKLKDSDPLKSVCNVIIENYGTED